MGNRDKTGQVVLGRAEWKDEGDGWRPRHFFELFPELLVGDLKAKEDNTPSCSLAGALDRQDLFINQAVVTWGLHLLWNFIRHGQTAIQGYFINLETGKVVPIPIQPPAPPTTPTPHAKTNPKAKPRKKTR